MTYFDSSALEHAGVKGMKWGVRRAAGGGGGTRRERREIKREATRQKDLSIVAARLRQEKRLGGLQNAAAQTYATTSKKGQAAALKAFEKAEKRYLTNPDAETSQKMTSGEKQVRGVILGLYGAAVVATLGSLALSAKG